MGHKEALQEVLAKVEAGVDCEKWGFCGLDVGLGDITVAHDAHNGSLDAAKALNEAVLGGWIYNLAPWGCHVFPPENDGNENAFTGINQNPARAWLIAIIKALIAQEHTTP